MSAYYVLHQRPTREYNPPPGDYDYNDPAKWNYMAFGAAGLAGSAVPVPEPVAAGQSTVWQQSPSAAAWSPQPATQPSYSGQPATQPSYSGQPATQPSYSRQQAAQPSYSGQPATQPSYSRQQAAQPSYSGQPATQPSYSGQPATQPSYSRQQAAQPSYPFQLVSQPMYSGQLSYYPVAVSYTTQPMFPNQGSQAATAYAGPGTHPFSSSMYQQQPPAYSMYPAGTEATSQPPNKASRSRKKSRKSRASGESGASRAQTEDQTVYHQQQDLINSQQQQGLYGEGKKRMSKQHGADDMMQQQYPPPGRVLPKESLTAYKKPWTPQNIFVWFTMLLCYCVPCACMGMILFVVARADYNHGIFRIAEKRRYLGCCCSTCAFLVGSLLWVLLAFCLITYYGYYEFIKELFNL